MNERRSCRGSETTGTPVSIAIGAISKGQLANRDLCRRDIEYEELFANASNPTNLADIALQGLQELGGDVSNLTRLGSHCMYAGLSPQDSLDFGQASKRSETESWVVERLSWETIPTFSINT